MDYTRMELRIMGVFAVIGVLFSWLVGGTNGMVSALLVFIGIDYATGIAAAWFARQLCSAIGFAGIKDKIIILIFVVVAHWLDVAIDQNGTFRSMVIFAYLGNEGISICENIDRMGYGKYIPGFLRSKFLRIREEKKNAGGKVE